MKRWYWPDHGKLTSNWWTDKYLTFSPSCKEKKLERGEHSSPECMIYHRHHTCSFSLFSPPGESSYEPLSSVHPDNTCSMSYIWKRERVLSAPSAVSNVSTRWSYWLICVFILVLISIRVLQKSGPRWIESLVERTGLSTRSLSRHRFQIPTSNKGSPPIELPSLRGTRVQAEVS